MAFTTILALNPHRFFGCRTRILYAALLCIYLCGSAWTAAAQPAGEDRGLPSSTNGATAALGFGAGIVAAYAVHEGAHWAAAGITGTDLHWESGTYNQPLGFTEDADSDTNGAVLHGAGLAGQALCGELILAWDSIDKTHPFVRGMMVWNVANPIIYAFDYWFLHSSNRIDAEGYQGDLAGIEHYAGQDVANTFAAASAALALWQGYRFWKAQDAPSSPTATALRLGIAPMPEGGALFSLKLDF
jgi:hypothetical protein